MEFDVENDLNAFILALPVVGKAFNESIGVAVTDKEKYLLYQPSRSLDLNIRPGTPVKPGTAVAKAMAEKKYTVIRGDTNVFGIPYIAMAYPIINDQGQVIGGIAVVETVERQDEMKDVAAKLNEMVSALASSSEEVSAQTEEITAVTGQVVHTAEALQEKAKDTEQALSLIRGIAAQTNLLGLNAAIEAARVGDQGRGFGVVANEIRKLATISAESVKKIADISHSIQADSEETYRQLKQVMESIGQIADAINHVAATIQDAGSMAERIDQIAEKLAAE